jgi:membrane protease subunit HflK
MDRNAQKINLLILAVLIASGLACFGVAARTHSLAGQTALWFFVVAFLVTLISWFQQRLHDRERLEQLEFDELSKSKGATSLFNTDDAGSFQARQSRIQFEKWFVPVYAGLLIAFQCWMVWHQWWKIGDQPQTVVNSEIGMGIYAAAFLGLMIIGLYSSGLAKHGKHHYLRPGAAYVLLNAYLCGAVAAGLFGVQIGGFKALDLHLARLLTILLGLITFEMALTLVFEVYRPRVKGREQHLLYESRIIGLLSRPDSLFTTAAQALDYQFGFKVSDTWFYQFLQRSIAWIVLFQVGLFWVSTSVVLIEPGEQGLRERMGKPVAGLLGPGIHFKLPWPMASIEKQRTSQVQSFVIGVVPEVDQPVSEYVTRVVQWSVSHNREEFNMLVASEGQQSFGDDSAGAVPVSLLTVSIPVQFAISDLTKWAYNNAEPAQLLEDIAQREVVRYLVNVDLLDVMGAGRAAAIKELTSRMQAAANKAELGVDILFVGLQDIHPPTAVAAAFQDVVGALQQKETAILKAEAYRAQLVPYADAMASNLVVNAQTYRIMTTNAAAATAVQFQQQLKAYTKSPEVYTERARLDTFARSAANARLYLLGVTNTDQVINFNLEEKTRADLMDIRVNDK